MSDVFYHIVGNTYFEILLVLFKDSDSISNCAGSNVNDNLKGFGRKF
jgi:hypothetical protein